MKNSYDTKAGRRFRLISRLQELGFTYDEAQTLRRIEMTLQRWAEHECNGVIQRDGDQGDGKPRWYYEINSGEHIKGAIIADREQGALKRLAKLMEAHPDYVAYHQGDPRGCALYIVPKAVLGGADINSVYNRGLAVCD